MAAAVVHLQPECSTKLMSNLLSSIIEETGNQVGKKLLG